MSTITLVTGGNRGIGREVCRQLAERGHTVLLTARSAEAAATAARAVGSLAYAGADPYGGTGHLDFGIPQARNRPLRITGPLRDERGRLAELLHIVFLRQRPAGPHVLAAQQSALPAQSARAAQPATLRLFTDLSATRAPLPHLRAALRSLP